MIWQIGYMIAYLMGAISGLSYLVQGWVVGSEGFSGTHHPDRGGLGPHPRVDHLAGYRRLADARRRRQPSRINVFYPNFARFRSDRTHQLLSNCCMIKICARSSFLTTTATSLLR